MSIAAGGGPSSMSAPLYGQVVVGPPGSGKTTYCDGMQQYLRALGRDAWVINLDPANEVPAASTAKKRRGGGVGGGGEEGSSQQERRHDGEDDDDANGNDHLPYDALFDVCQEVVNLSSVMGQLNLGPNGGLVYCMEYMEAHSDDVSERIRQRIEEHVAGGQNGRKGGGRPYLILDLPGQVELYTHSTVAQKLLKRISTATNGRFAAVQLIDAHYCTDASRFLSAALLGTTTMIRLELPAVNVLSKVDLLERYGALPMRFEYFTQCHDLDRLLPFLDDQATGASKRSHRFEGGGGGGGGEDKYDFDDDDDYDYDGDGTLDDVVLEDEEYRRARDKRRRSASYRKYAKLHESLAEVIEDFGLLSFVPLNITDAESVGRVLSKIDRCNGYVFLDDDDGGAATNADALFHCAVQSDSMSTSTYESIANVQERIGSQHHPRRPGKPR